MRKCDRLACLRKGYKSAPVTPTLVSPSEDGFSRNGFFAEFFFSREFSRKPFANFMNFIVIWIIYVTYLL